MIFASQNLIIKSTLYKTVLNISNVVFIILFSSKMQSIRRLPPHMRFVVI